MGTSAELHKAAAIVGQRGRMLHRAFALIATATLSIAATAPPAVLAPYIHDGHFDPGYYGWLRGSFPDATAAQKADTATITAWLAECRKEGGDTAHADLTAMGVKDSKLDDIIYSDQLCWVVAFSQSLPASISYAAFADELPRARLVADTYLAAVDIAQRDSGGAVLATTIAAKPVGEQMLRKALSWGQGEASKFPALDPVALAIVKARLSAALTQLDHANTEWLKNLVARDGWPSISTSGIDAARSAWLLVQHADADPAFQLKMLRLMEPLDEKHDLPPHNYAYLYDRVMLKLVGKQRYGTQVTCRAGHRIPRPLEDAVAVAEWRRKVGWILLRVISPALPPAPRTPLENQLPTTTRVG